MLGFIKKIFIGLITSIVKASSLYQMCILK